MTAARAVGHRFSTDDLAPPAGRLSARDALTQLQDRGLDQVSGSDLEVYRLVMLPAEFKRLCARLDRAVIAHYEQTRRGAWSAEGLPFGTDLQPAVDRERRRRWAHRPNGEPLPRCWSVETECQPAWPVEADRRS